MHSKRDLTQFATHESYMHTIFKSGGEDPIGRRLAHSMLRVAQSGLAQRLRSEEDGKYNIDNCKSF